MAKITSPATQKPEDLRNLRSIGNDHETTELIARISGLNFVNLYFAQHDDLFATLYQYPEIKDGGKRGNLTLPVPVDIENKPGILPVKSIHFMQRAARWASLKDKSAEETEDNTSFDVVQNAQKIKEGILKIEELPKIEVFQDSTGKIWTTSHRRLAAFILSGVVAEVPVKWLDSKDANSQLVKFYPIDQGNSLDIVNRFKGWAIRISHNNEIQNRSEIQMLLEDLPKESAKICRLVDTGRKLPFWIERNVYIKNALEISFSELAGTFRKDSRTPYMDHPVRLAILLQKLLPTGYPNKAATIAGALTHDLLEEGKDGVSNRSISELRTRMSEISKTAFLSAAILTEPPLNYSKYLQQFDFEGNDRERLKQIEKTAYILQTVLFIKSLSDNGRQDMASSLLNIALADKIVNANDFNYVFENTKISAEDRRRKISLAVGTYCLVYNMLKEYASPELANVLEHSIRRFASKVGLSESEIQTSYYNAWKGLNSVRIPITEEIERFLSDMRIA